jgi:hypothetical protein
MRTTGSGSGQAHFLSREHKAHLRIAQAAKLRLYIRNRPNGTVRLADVFVTYHATPLHLRCHCHHSLIAPDTKRKRLKWDLSVVRSALVVS